MEVKLAFGFCPEKITVEQAQNSNPRWIVLDRYSVFKLFKMEKQLMHTRRRPLKKMWGSIQFAVFRS